MARKSIGFAVLAVLFAGIGSARAMTLASGNENIVELLAQSNDIVVGRVDSVTDGFDDRGIPYTEVTLEVTEAIRGGISGTYTFRQFGLMTPRLIPEGTRSKLMASPPGFPKYKAGEELALFLRPSASWTGFRMPAGVTRGKFTIDAGRAENDMGNAGLFRDVHLDKELITDPDKRLLTNASGALNPDAFLSFVRRAVQERWLETNRMSRSDRHDGPRVPPPSEPGGVRAQAPAEPPAAPVAPLDPNALIGPVRPGK
jgi:hypothetical protein